MKKTAILLCACALVLSVLTSCGQDNTNPGSSSVLDTPAPDENTVEENIPKAYDLKLGLGIVSSPDGSIPADKDNNGRVKMTTTICAVALDNSGTVRHVKFDTVKTDHPFDMTGSFLEDISLPIRSFKEMGFDLGLMETSPLKREWFQQINSFEDWIMGKNTDEIINMELDDNNIPTSKDLNTLMDIGVRAEIEAFKKAVNDAK